MKLICNCGAVLDFKIDEETTMLQQEWCPSFLVDDLNMKAVKDEVWIRCWKCGLDVHLFVESV